MKIEQYNESLSDYINLVHEAAEGRHNLTGYELHVIEAALLQLQDSMKCRCGGFPDCICDIVKTMNHENPYDLSKHGGLIK